MNFATSITSSASIHEDVDEYLDGRRPPSVIVVRKGRIPPRRKNCRVAPRYIALPVSHESSAQIFDDIAITGIANAKLLMRCASAARDRANLASATRSRRSIEHRRSVSRASFSHRKSMSRASMQLSGLFHNEPSYNWRALHKSSCAASHTRPRPSNWNVSLINGSSLIVRVEASFAPSSPMSDVLLSHSSLRSSCADFAAGAGRGADGGSGGARSPSFVRNDDSAEVSPERSFQPLVPNLNANAASHPPLAPKPTSAPMRTVHEGPRATEVKASHPPLAPRPRKSLVSNILTQQQQQQQQQQAHGGASARASVSRNGRAPSAHGKPLTVDSVSARSTATAMAAVEAMRAMTANSTAHTAVAAAAAAAGTSNNAHAKLTHGNGARGSVAQPSPVPPEKAIGKATPRASVSAAPGRSSLSHQPKEQPATARATGTAGNAREHRASAAATGTSAAVKPAALQPASAQPMSARGEASAQAAAAAPRRSIAPLRPLTVSVPSKPTSVRSSVVSSSRNGSLVPPRPGLPANHCAANAAAGTMTSAKAKAAAGNKPQQATTTLTTTAAIAGAAPKEAHVLPALRPRGINSNSNNGQTTSRITVKDNTNTNNSNKQQQQQQKTASPTEVVTSSADSQGTAPLPRPRADRSPRTLTHTAPPERLQQPQQPQQQGKGRHEQPAAAGHALPSSSSRQTSSASATGAGSTMGGSSSRSTTYTTTTITTGTAATPANRSPSIFSYHQHNNSTSIPTFTTSTFESEQSSPQSAKVHPVPSTGSSSLVPAIPSTGTTGDNMDFFPLTRLHMNGVTTRRHGPAGQRKLISSNASQYDYAMETPNTTAALLSVPSPGIDSVSNRAESMFETTEFDSPLNYTAVKAAEEEAVPSAHAVAPLSDALHTNINHHNRSPHPLLPSQPPSPLLRPPASPPLPSSQSPALSAHGRRRLMTNATVIPSGAMEIIVNAAYQPGPTPLPHPTSPSPHLPLSSPYARFARMAGVPPAPPPTTTTAAPAAAAAATQSPASTRPNRSPVKARATLPTPSSASNSPRASLAPTIAFESQEDDATHSLVTRRTRSRSPTTTLCTPYTPASAAGGRPKPDAVQPTVSTHSNTPSSSQQQQQQYAGKTVNETAASSTAEQPEPRLASRRQRRVSDHARHRRLVISEL